LEVEDELVYNLFSDIRYLLKLIKAEPKKITIIVSPVWKYKFYQEFKRVFAKTKNISEIIKTLMQTPLKQYGNEITKLIPKLIEKQPSIIMSQEKEFKIFSSNKELIEKEFNCEIILEKAEKSQNEKSKFALPGKPSILIQ